MLKIRRVIYEPVEMQREDLMSVKEASDVLGMTMAGVVRAVERGALTEVIDEEAGSHHGRRLVLRKEVEELRRKREG